MIDPPYFAVIFSSHRRAEPGDGYGEMAERMKALAAQQPGFLGIESARDGDGFGITVSYWATRDDVTAWGRHAEHLLAQRFGREKWYRSFSLRVCRVEAARNFATESGT
ncbi:antibiotic biosynthesis monooxygenase [Gemmata sp. JC717]|uniref:antibiotic biosynthesis monooxygenase family protein n=1 Tax=Gemmata algarum TaxID=2975278 RepID=UPI0021BB7A27|nr:antibiotic biosynthesis monooxygenase [Gemmata algarum]MDY3554188.1 antibiotic biosynthesis monooxygenase [Gemmata algarum]